MERSRRRPSTATLCRLLDRRAECHRLLGAFTAEAADLDALLLLAREHRDAPLQITTLHRHAWAMRKLGDLQRSVELAGEALNLARSLTDLDERTIQRLQAIGLAMLSNGQSDLGEISKAEETVAEAIRLCHCCGRRLRQRHLLYGHSRGC